MGCVLGESADGRGPTGPLTLKSDVSWVGTGGKLRWRAVAGARRGVKRKMTRRIYYAHEGLLCLLCCLSGGPGLYREDRETHKNHTAKIAYICIHVNEYIHSSSHTRQTNANWIPKEIIHWKDTHQHRDECFVWLLQGPMRAIPRGDRCQCDCHYLTQTQKTEAVP